MREPSNRRAPSRSLRRRAYPLLLALGVALSAGAQEANRDYYNPGTDGEARDLFKNVHLYHMGPGIEALGRREYPRAQSEFLFILRFYPNHPEALNLMSDLCINRWKVPRCEVDSWFSKAIARNPNAAKTYVVHGIHLQRQGKHDQSIAALDKALTLEPDSINAHYTLGLVYVSKKDYEKANRHAQAAYALGAELPGLREQLVRVGKWKPQDSARPADAVGTSKPAIDPGAGAATPADSAASAPAPAAN